MDISLCVAIVILSAITVEVRGADCPELYRRYSDKHTFCKPPNTKCSIGKKSVSNEDIAIILKAHNTYRSRVATGKETIGNLPSATNMLEMEWDKELAAVAQKFAEQCVYDHDCNECRQVKNFGVGQNLAQGGASSDNLSANWNSIVKLWYDEVSKFNKRNINPFVFSKPIGHFSQVVWAKSWKVGCGFAAYKSGNSYNLLYICNYGPAGNGRSAMYETGDVCSKCPENSCCGASCSAAGLTAEYPGLCKSTDHKAPVYKQEKGVFLYNCDFHDQPECQTSVTSGVSKWKVEKTLTGNYLSIVLNGGESTTLDFKMPVKGKHAVCIRVTYRRGPNVAGQAVSGTAKQIFTMVSDGSANSSNLRASSMFTSLGMGLPWGDATKVSVSFSVPNGAPAQYFEIQSVTGKEGGC